MAIEKVGVVGCGLMGSGIAQVAANAGCQVTVREVTPQLVEKGLQSIDKNLQRLVDKGTLPPGRDPEHQRSQHQAHDHQGDAGVAGLGRPEDAHAVGDGLGAGQRRAPRGERLHHDEHRCAEQETVARRPHRNRIHS